MNFRFSSRWKAALTGSKKRRLNVFHWLRSLTRAVQDGALTSDEALDSVSDRDFVRSIPVSRFRSHANQPVGPFRDPLFGVLCCALTYSLVNVERAPEAVAFLDIVLLSLQQAPDVSTLAEIRKVRGMTFACMRRLGDAIGEFQQAEALFLSLQMTNEANDTCLRRLMALIHTNALEAALALTLHTDALNPTPDHLREYHHSRAKAYFEREEYEQATRDATLAAGYCTTADSKEILEECTTLCAVADVLAAVYQSDAAGVDHTLSQLQNALTSLEQTDSCQFVPRLLEARATLLYRLTRFPEATTDLSRAIALNSESGDARSLMRCHMDRARVHYALSEFTAEYADLSTVLQIMKRVGAEAHLYYARVLTYAGGCLERLGELRDAAATYQTAAVASLGCGEPAFASTCHLESARLLARLDADEDALQQCSQGLACCPAADFERIGNGNALAGYLLGQLRRYQDAADAYERADHALAHCDSGPALASCLQGRADALVNGRINIALAIDLCNRAIPIFEAHSQTDSVAACLRIRGGAHLHLGDGAAGFADMNTAEKLSPGQPLTSTDVVLMLWQKVERNKLSIEEAIANVSYLDFGSVSSHGVSELLMLLDDKARRGSPDVLPFADLLLGYADGLNRAGWFKPAVAICDVIIPVLVPGDDGPRLAHAHLSRSHAYGNLGMNEEAAADLRCAEMHIEGVTIEADNEDRRKAQRHIAEHARVTRALNLLDNTGRVTQEILDTLYAARKIFVADGASEAAMKVTMQLAHILASMFQSCKNADDLETASKVSAMCVSEVEDAEALFESVGLRALLEEYVAKQRRGAFLFEGFHLKERLNHATDFLVLKGSTLADLDRNGDAVAVFQQVQENLLRPSISPMFYCDYAAALWNEKRSEEAMDVLARARKTAKKQFRSALGENLFRFIHHTHQYSKMTARYAFQSDRQTLAFEAVQDVKASSIADLFRPS